MSTEIIHIAGRYNKYLRNLSQSPWIDKNDVRVTDSVQEIIEEGLKKYLQFGKSVFVSSGREDVDVRMLGRGRPFTFKLHNPKNVEDFNVETLKLVQNFVNEKSGDKIRVRDLQIVSKSDVAKYLKEGQESKEKEYRALCCCSRKLSSDDIQRINGISDLVLNQRTPIRVLHRRTLSTRQRTIHHLKIEPVNVGDFKSVRHEYIDNVFALNMLTEAGTYIKEFVHGDFGRTEPSLSTLLGDCDTDLMELDVMEVHLDWPASIPNDSSTFYKTKLTTDSLAYQANEVEQSDEDLAELYANGLVIMEEALCCDRGDKKEDLLVRARKIFEKAAGLVESLTLFSDNETLDDLATVNLKYLLIDAYLAKLSISGDISSRRLQAFSRSENFIKQFLNRIASYNPDHKRINQSIKAIDEPVDMTNRISIEDQARVRNQKIESFNKNKELEKKLEELKRRIKSNQESDDEEVRDYYLRLIDKWINDTLDDLDGIIKPALMFERGGFTKQISQNKILPETSIKSNDGGKNLVITKDMLKNQVFGAGYPSLASVSVDQFITKKIADGDLAFHSQKEIYSNSLQRYAEQPNLRREQEEKSDEEREGKEEHDDQVELARKRRWDEFKDDNPRGSGNRQNMG